MMAPYPHPRYSKYMVYADKARAGAFYQVKRGDTLSRMALQAYGSGKKSKYQIINTSQYNSQFTRREHSTKCLGKRKDYPDGFIALCPPYPLIWIPDANGSEPSSGVTAARVPHLPNIVKASALMQPNSTLKPVNLPPGVAHALRAQITPLTNQQRNAAQIAAAIQQQSHERFSPVTSSGGIPSWLWPVAIFGGIAIVAIVVTNRGGA